jgi:hypothetical protein
MAIITVQKLARGRLPAGGRVYIGEYGNAEPETSGITVYLDYLFTKPVTASNGFPLDRDGYPLLNGQRVNLYTNLDYSFMIRTEQGARFWSEARQVTIPIIKKDLMQATSLELDTSSSDANLIGKTLGLGVWNTDTLRYVYATGESAIDVWNDALGQLAHTPG